MGTSLIHSLAHINESSVGTDSNVWQFASIIRHARIGARCTVGANAIIDAALVGNDCIIGAASQLHPGTFIGNNVFIGPGVIFCNDRWPRVSKEGFNSKEILGQLYFTVRVEDNASIGAGCIILPGVTIGKGAMVAAGLTIRESVPQFYLVKKSGEYVPMSPRVPERIRYAKSL
jgi:UDP-2-acetamido-3-amino-2,3-dideoxy-glucuronate N-acetyltransferase